MHGLGQVFTSLQQRIAPPDTVMTTCPPGNILPGDAPFIIVASLRRSGTHLMIDAILNNFELYKRRPLYINLEQYLKSGRPLAELLRCRGYVIKTHYPLSLTRDYDEQVQEVAKDAFVITPYRPADDVYRSTVTFGAKVSREEFDKRSQEFDAFWQPYQPMMVPFATLIEQQNYGTFVQCVGEYIGVKPNGKTILPFGKDQRWRVYLVKLITRLVGRYSPVVNTTIAFAKPSIETY